MAAGGRCDTLSFTSTRVPAREKVRSHVSFFFSFTKLFQIVHCICLTIQTQFISFEQQGGLGFISIFYFFFFSLSAGLSGKESKCSRILRGDNTGHCSWRRTRTFFGGNYCDSARRLIPNFETLLFPTIMLCA